MYFDHFCFGAYSDTVASPASTMSSLIAAKSASAKKGRPSSLPMSLDTQFLPPRGRGYDNAHDVCNTRCSFA